MGVWVFTQWPKKGSPLAHACLVGIEQHRELVAAFEARIRSGAIPGNSQIQNPGNTRQPAKVWQRVLADARLVPTWKLGVLLAIERRRLALGWSNEKISDEAGIGERGFSKYLRAWRRTAKHYRRGPVKVPGCGGRNPTAETLRKLAKAIAAGDRLGPLEVKPVAMTRETYERRLDNLAVRHQRSGPHVRTLLVSHMGAISPLGVAGRKAKVPPEARRRVASLGAAALHAKRTPEQRSAAARAAAHARWGTAPRLAQESASCG